MMAVHSWLTGGVASLIGTGAIPPTGVNPSQAAAPVIAVAFMVWVLVSAVLSINHPVISTHSLAFWFLLFFPVSVFLDGNVGAYLTAWYVYIALSFVSVFIGATHVSARRRRFLLQWKGTTLVAITIVALAAQANALAGVGGYLDQYAAPDFIRVFGTVSWLVFTFTFLAYYATTRHSHG